jgi:hypothetical protein
MEFIIFVISTDGIILLLFLFKCIYGVKFFVYTWFPKASETRRKTERRQTEKDLQRFKMRKTKNQRRELNKYFMFSVVTYFFVVIQSLSLIFPYIYDKSMLIRTLVKACLALLAIVYISRKIYQLLEEKDFELRDRSIMVGGDKLVHYVDTEGNERDSEKGDYLPPVDPI